jgi:uncharacterized protein YxjI
MPGRRARGIVAGAAAGAVAGSWSSEASSLSSSPLRDRCTIDVPGGDALHVTGNLLAHEYRIERGGAPVATVSKRWFRVRDSYGVVAWGEVAALFLAIAVVIDVIVHQAR